MRVDYRKIFPKIVDMNAQKMIEQIDSVIQQLLAVQAAIKATVPAVVPSLAFEEEAELCHYCKTSTKGEKVVRGDHERCYKEIMRGIAAGEVTEEAVLAKGWIAPAKPAGRKKNATPLRQLAEEASTIIAKAIVEEIDTTKTKKVADKKSGYRKKSE